MGRVVCNIKFDEESVTDEHSGIFQVCHPALNTGGEKPSKSLLG